MAINPETQYAGKIAPATAAYPYGQARNITLPGDGTGTPWEAALVNDIFGFQQSLLSEAEIVPTGDPEEVGASQYLEAIRKIVGDVVGSTSDALAGKTIINGSRVVTRSFLDGQTKGGSTFIARSGRTKADHNGVTVISPTVPGVTDQAGATFKDRLQNFFDGAGETDPGGSGCFVAEYQAVLTGYQAGMTDTADDADRNACQALVNAVLSEGARLAILPFEVDRTFDDRLDVPRAVALDLNGSIVDFVISGSTRGFVLSNRSEIYNGTITVTGTSPSGGGDAQSPVSGGNQTTGVGIKGARAHSLSVDTNRPDGNGVVFFGECRRCTVEDIETPDSSTMARVVAFEWGGSTSGTGHPHDNTIRNINAGVLSNTASNAFVVWLSSAFNIEVTNVYSPDCYGLVGVFTGDQANEYAPATYKALVGSGIVVNNPSGKTRRHGVRVYGKGAAIVTPLFERPIINNPNIEGTGTSDSEFGIFCGFTGGVVINNPTLRRLGYGVITDEDAQHVKVNDGQIFENQRNGIRFGNSNGISDCWVQGTRLYKNNQAGGSGVSSAAGVALAFAKNSGVIACKFGLAEGETETQQYSVFLEGGNCEFCEVSQNHTYALLAGGVAYVNGVSTDFDQDNMGQNNTATAGITKSGGAPFFTIDERGNKKFTFPGSAGFPASGSWQEGDYFVYDIPTNYIGGVYSAGVWKNYGAIV